MVNICLIGCGGVGRRHLEAILKVKYDINIEVVEPNIESIKSTKELLPDFNNYFNKIDDVSDNIDICLIATTANVRKKVILELVSKKTVKFMILEKVVFQNEDDFDEIIKLFKEKNIKSWVNCHLRTQPIYKEVKRCSIVSEDTFFKYEYSDDFTLSTSAIHILDLFSYLCDDYDLEIKSISTDTELKKSRHGGCVDFNGEMVVKSTSGHKLVVKKRDAVFGEHLTISRVDLVIRSSEGDDPDNRIGYVQGKAIPYIWQSSLTNSYIDDIIEKYDCDLSTLENSAKLHKMMLKSFRNLLKENYNREVVDCPIT